MVFCSSIKVYAWEGDRALGKVLYKRECAVCHGAEGKGDGKTAPFLFPKPRDLTSGVFKLRSTTFLPTDDDLFHTIDKGIPGTLMPSFSYLSSEEIKALLVYTKGFTDKFDDAGTLEPITIPRPPPRTEELVLEGKQLYNEFGCIKCHGPTGKGDGPSAASLKDVWGEPIIPYDFTIPNKMKAGSTVEVTYRTLVVGIGGTPMPSYGEPESIEDQKMFWAIAYFVNSLQGKEPVHDRKGDSAMGKSLFIGAERFQNGGTPCIACHDIAGISALGGGILGPGLTVAFGKFHEDGLTTVLSDMVFPTMQAIYNKKSVTAEEQSHLIEYLQEVADNPRAPGANTNVLMGTLGAVGVLLLLGLYLFIWSGRKKDSVNQDIYDRQIKSE